MDYPDLEKILRTALSSQRFAYDYTGSWCFLSLTKEEHKSLLQHFGLEMPKPELPKRPDRKKYDPKTAKTFTKKTETFEEPT